MNITADATLPGALGSFGYDDEGTPAHPVDIVVRQVAPLLTNVALQLHPLALEDVGIHAKPPSVIARPGRSLGRWRSVEHSAYHEPPRRERACACHGSRLVRAVVL